MRHSLSFSLSYADTDPSGLVYFATWFPWMERCQSAWFHQHGLRQDTMLAEHGFGTVTRWAECDYRAATALYDSITVTATVAELGRSSFTTQHDFVRATDDVLVARGRLVVVTVAPDGGSVPLPDLVRRTLEETP